MFPVKRFGYYKDLPKDNEALYYSNGLRDDEMKHSYKEAFNGEHQGIKQNSVQLPDGEELEYLTFPVLEQTGLVRHLFTTRLGGVSRQEFATMNFSVERGDNEKNVAANYARIAWVLGCSVEDMVASHQTHTVNIRRITSADRGKGIVRPRDYQDVDGLMTNEGGIVLVTYYADCVPLFFVDVRNRAVGLAHSGWRGTAAGMGRHMVRAMRESFGTKPEDLRVAIGPSICRDCYEVGEDVAASFIKQMSGEAPAGEICMGKRQPEAVVTRGRQPGKYQLDLWLANRRILESAGVPRENIEMPDICTCENSGYLFSHRASRGKRGNMGAFLGLL